ncbi:MAG: molybdopterin-dependent oxidoreductase [Chloroflexi bacterium]|nr:molybdopterin-dependent oxidoreductase [Chloroflexota bacterium]
MPRRLTNLLLYLLVVAEVATGILGWLLPEARALPLYDLHRLFGTALVLLLFWKQVVVRSSLRRRLGRGHADRSVLVGALTGLALLGTLGLGLAWTLQLVSFDALWGYSPLNIHVFLALGTLPLLLWHLLRRRERGSLAKDLATRRSALRLVGLSIGALFAWQAFERVADARAAAGSRRASGSKHAGSFSGNDFPVTIWQLDRIPGLDPATWRLGVGGRVAVPASLSYADLDALESREMTTVIDCTGGWWSEQVWQGVSVGDVLAASGVAAGASAVEVVSVTGHHWTFPLDELRGALLATRVGGETLTPGHGYPVRLVAPGRRGFQWIKWVDRLEVI